MELSQSFEVAGFLLIVGVTAGLLSNPAGFPVQQYLVLSLHIVSGDHEGH